METCCVSFEVETECLNIIYMSFVWDYGNHGAAVRMRAVVS
jgi:hypothetical protein